MAIDATTVEQVTVNPINVRYSLNVDKFGSVSRGFLNLQRSEKRNDGTWMDDPHPDSRKTVPMITGSAFDGIAALLPVLLPLLGVTDSYTDYRLQARGGLSKDGVLDVSITLQVRTTSWIAKVIPSLTAFLTANPAIAVQVLSAWNDLDAAINAANQEEKWL